MTLAASYALAVLPQRFTVLGQILEPFTLGHALLLTRLESPFAPFSDHAAAPADSDGVGELVAAIWVCAQPWRHAAKHLASRRTRWLMRGWQWQLNWGKLARASALFQAYLVESTRGPRTFAKDTDSQLRSPSIAVIRVLLANAFGLTPDQSLDTPLAAALWDLAAYQELKGNVELVDPVRAAALEAARQPLAN